jgi:hypothetical protein
VTQSHMDDNDRARFVDGLMPETERNATVAHLAASEEEAALLADVAYMLADLDPDGGVVADEDDDADAVPLYAGVDTATDPKVVPLHPASTRRGWRRAPARWMALAAMVAGVLLVPLALSRTASTGSNDFAVLLERREAGLPAGWLDESPWRATRGPADVAAANALAVRVGALNVDLDLAIVGRQAEQTAELADQIAYLLENASWTGPGLVAPGYHDISRRASESQENLAPSLAKTRDLLAETLDADYFGLGAWLEAARLAANTHDAAFFRRRASRKMMDRAALLLASDGEASAALEAIRTAARADQPDWTVLETQTRGLLGHLGG